MNEWHATEKRNMTIPSKDSNHTGLCYNSSSAVILCNLQVFAVHQWQLVTIYSTLSSLGERHLRCNLNPTDQIWNFLQTDQESSRSKHTSICRAQCCCYTVTYFRTGFVEDEKQELPGQKVASGSAVDDVCPRYGHLFSQLVLWLWANPRFKLIAAIIN